MRASPHSGQSGVTCWTGTSRITGRARPTPQLSGYHPEVPRPHPHTQSPGQRAGLLRSAVKEEGGLETQPGLLFWHDTFTCFVTLVWAPALSEPPPAHWQKWRPWSVDMFESTRMTSVPYPTVSEGPPSPEPDSSPLPSRGPGTSPHTYQQNVSNHCPVAGQKQLPKGQEHLWTRTAVTNPSLHWLFLPAQRQGLARLVGEERPDPICGPSGLQGGPTLPSGRAAHQDPEDRAGPRDLMNGPLAQALRSVLGPSRRGPGLLGPVLHHQPHRRVCQ